MSPYKTVLLKIAAEHAPRLIFYFINRPESTHNTVASLMAILTHNHGYNATYSQGKQSLACAMTDIRCQMALGRIRSALVLEFDEQVDTWDEVLSHIGEKTHNIARAQVYLKNE